MKDNEFIHTNILDDFIDLCKDIVHSLMVMLVTMMTMRMMVMVTMMMMVLTMLWMVIIVMKMLMMVLMLMMMVLVMMMMMMLVMMVCDARLAPGPPHTLSQGEILVWGAPAHPQATTPTTREFLPEKPKKTKKNQTK